MLTALIVVSAACGGAADDVSGTVDDVSSTVSAGGSVSVLEVEVGDCFNDPEDLSAVLGVETAPCDQPHDNEIFALPQYSAGSDEPFPGTQALQSFAEQACVDAFEDYVGIPYEDSLFLYGPISPSAGTWADGDREVICFLYHPDLEKLEGSMLKAAR